MSHVWLFSNVCYLRKVDFTITRLLHVLVCSFLTRSFVLTFEYKNDWVTQYTVNLSLSGHPEYSTGMETVLGVCVYPLITPCECVMCFMDFGIFSSQQKSTFPLHSGVSPDVLGQNSVLMDSQLLCVFTMLSRQPCTQHTFPTHKNHLPTDICKHCRAPSDLELS